MTHGGPQAADKFSIGSAGYEIQVLAGKGYAVLQPNYRGSTGYGDPFLRDMVGHYFQNAHLDVMAGVDELIARGIADPRPHGEDGLERRRAHDEQDHHVHGSLQGGRVRSGRGATGRRCTRRATCAFYRTPWFGGTPWQKNAPIDVYWNNSPLKDVANVKTPTIFFVGEKDPRVPLPQSVEMYQRAEDQRRPDAPLRRAARAARLGRTAARAFQDERRDRVVREVRHEASLHLGEGPRRRQEKHDNGDRPARVRSASVSLACSAGAALASGAGSSFWRRQAALRRDARQRASGFAHRGPRAIQLARELRFQEALLGLSGELCKALRLVQTREREALRRAQDRRPLRGIVMEAAAARVHHRIEDPSEPDGGVVPSLAASVRRRVGPPSASNRSRASASARVSASSDSKSTPSALAWKPVTTSSNSFAVAR